MANTVSLVITILNEAATLPVLLDSITAQKLRPYETIIVDGGSTDDSIKILNSYSRKLPHLKIYTQPGNRSVGRNFGVLHSKSKIIAFTDAGCIPHPDWLKNLIAPFSDPQTTVVSGYYQGSYTNSFEKSLLPYVLVMPDKIPSKFFPSTRSMAILKQVFVKSGGFDEHLYHNEDFAYATKLDQLGYHFTFAKDALVTWLPRKNLKSAMWMFFRFAVGDMQAGIFRPKVKLLLIRYAIAVYLFFLSLEIRPLIPVYCLLLTVYLLWSIYKNFRYVKALGGLFWLPVLQLTSDLSVVFGTLVGIVYKMSTP